MLSWPTAAWILDPTQSANSGPPVHRLTLTSVVRMPRARRVSTRPFAGCPAWSTTIQRLPRASWIVHASLTGGGARRASLDDVPRHWFWTQVAIVVFVLAGMVIAITKL